MSLVYQRADSGLVVASHGAGEAAVARALREFDDDLRLVKQYSDENQRQVWKVFVYRGPDTPAVFLTGWWDEHGVPFPELTMLLVEKVKRLHKNSRAPGVDIDKENAVFTQARRRQERQDDADIADDWMFKHGRPVLHRGQHLRVSRDKRRARGENV